MTDIDALARRIALIVPWRPSDEILEVTLAALRTAYATGRSEGFAAGAQAMRERAARLLEIVAETNDESKLGDAAADAFNAGTHREMTARLQDWNGVLAVGIRALPLPDEKEKP